MTVSDATTRFAAALRLLDPTPDAGTDHLAHRILVNSPDIAADLHDAPYLRAIEEAARAYLPLDGPDWVPWPLEDKLRAALAAYDAARQP